MYKVGRSDENVVQDEKLLSSFCVREKVDCDGIEDLIVHIPVKKIFHFIM